MMPPTLSSGHLSASDERVRTATANDRSCAAPVAQIFVDAFEIVARVDKHKVERLVQKAL